MFGGIVEYSEHPEMWRWSGVQAIETMAPTTAWPRLRTAAKGWLSSETGPMILET